MAATFQQKIRLDQEVLWDWIFSSKSRQNLAISKNVAGDFRRQRSFS
jgi:hypothetical protein